MTSENQPSGSEAPASFDITAALARSRALGLKLDETVLPGVEANLELLALHHASVLRGLVSSDEASS
jgi:hypothetical protein